MNVREHLAQRIAEDPEFRAVWEARSGHRAYIKRMVRAQISFRPAKKRRR